MQDTVLSRGGIVVSMMINFGVDSTGHGVPRLNALSGFVCEMSLD